ncbi:MAG TPA: hypothetical protein VGO48_13860 [Conexibacter sp.]|jgi:hypothetical protein|nr:hypothetical protein [Conexibacter sp.]
MKVAAFLIALAAAFGIAVAAGAAWGPEPTADPPATRDSAMAGHDEGTGSSTPAAHGADHAASTAPRGLATAVDGLRLVVATPELERGRTRTVRFRIVDAHNRAVRDFDLGHERRMHTIVVRRDLAGFQHVHPHMDTDGTWSVPLRLDAPGSYRLYADFAHDGEARTLAGELRVDGDVDLLALPAPASTAASDGGDTVRLDAERTHAGRETRLRFAVERDARPVALEPYLGAGGHLVTLREGDLAFLHVHPLAGGEHGDADEGSHDHPASEHRAPDGRIAFATTFPSAGRYRLFLQYRVGAQVRTVGFTLEVTP